MLALILNLAVPALKPSLGAGGGGVVYTPDPGAASAIGHRVTIAAERESHRISISLSDPVVGVAAGVGTSDASTIGPYFNRHIQSGVGLVSFDVMVSGNPNLAPMVVPFTVTGGVEGTHYNIPFASPLIIPAGAASGKLWIDFISSNRWFAQKDITITLGTADDSIPRGEQSYSFYLRPTQAAPVVTWDGSTASGTEEGGPITQTLSIPVLQQDDVTVYLELTGGTATLDTGDGLGDYTTSTLDVVITRGQTTATFTVTPIDDAEVEGNETALYTIVNDARTSQVNLWSYSDRLGETEGPVFGQGINAGRPTDNVYVDDTADPVGWSLDTVPAGTTPDTRLPGYRFVVTELGFGSCKIGKSINASTGDELGNSVGGFDQLITLAAENCLSVYVRRPATGFFGTYFSLDIYDRLDDTHHRVRFGWSGTTPTVDSADAGVGSGVMSSQAWDNDAASNGWHRIYIQYTAPAGEQGHYTNRYLEAFTEATDEDTELNRGKGVEFAWPQFEQGVTTPTAYQRNEASHWEPWGGCTLGSVATCTFTITNTDS